MSDKIKEALQKLDASNENHWTQDGSPRLETVKFNNGGEAVSREEIEAAFPGFNKSTAAAYWLTYQQPASGAPQGTEGTAPEQGSGDPAATPPAAPQAGDSQPPSVEGAAPAPEPGAGAGDPPAETEQPEVGSGDDDDDADEDEVAALEASFQEIQEHLTGLRGQVDDLNLGIDRVAQIEQKVHNAIQRAKRERGDHKPATHIQQYLASQKARAVERGHARKALVESGVSLKELAKLTGKSPLDQSMARPTARRGRGSKGM